MIVFGAIGAAVAVPPLLRWRKRSLTFEPIAGLPGFRRLPSGTVSGGDFILTGLQPASAQQSRLRDGVVANPCLAAFGRTDWPAGRTPVAVFTDYNCPYCPVLSGMVIDLLHRGAPIDVTWHDLPVLGPRSEDAARAAIAAARQGQYLPVHQHLMRGVLRPGPAALTGLAESFGLDPQRFLHDAQSVETAHRIEQARAVAAVFGIAGTPAILVGRSLSIGRIEPDRLDRLIALEAQASGAVCAPGG
ncbi:DsbA family protein [Sedimentitalea sp. HM32M-2]|uniref:DsbA family protein n=1 Tax=Sedimentitalea sp. HM32M-2 TaxID=3351566 RepID=UPI0036284731